MCSPRPCAGADIAIRSFEVRTIEPRGWKVGQELKKNGHFPCIHETHRPTDTSTQREPHAEPSGVVTSRQCERMRALNSVRYSRPVTFASFERAKQPKPRDCYVESLLRAVTAKGPSPRSPGTEVTTAAPVLDTGQFEPGPRPSSPMPPVLSPPLRPAPLRLNADTRLPARSSGDRAMRVTGMPLESRSSSSSSSRRSSHERLRGAGAPNLLTDADPASPENDGATGPEGRMREIAEPPSDRGAAQRISTRPRYCGCPIAVVNMPLQPKTVWRID